MNKCIFCSEIRLDQVLLETENFKVVFDIAPVQSGHLLIISKAHIMDIRELEDSILLEMVKLEQALVRKIYESISVDGVSIIENNGSIMDEGTHLHVHLVPRYQNDKFWDNQVVVFHEGDKDLLKANIEQLYGN
ncbi:MAG: HIT family protein [Lactococcus sp.]